ncbi:hypothetical protein SRCM100730_03973 [Bacillus velezensis]|nr:hypothetical protein CHN56_03230 [Bacillus velezensis]OBR33830.1 hypothetical protein SRCM100731_01120 [Bacillus velezensis]OCB92644.1 hypothetical protein SRCM100730_03973 [Bacillus velezensis]
MTVIATVFLIEGFDLDATVIVVVPAALAVTKPELDTVAVAVLLDVKVTLWSALEGVTVALILYVSPTVKVLEVSVTLTPVGSVANVVTESSALSGDGSPVLGIART